MDIEDLRGQIDGIDRRIVDLYCKRMDVARSIGRYKKEKNLPVLDSERERNLLNKVADLAGEEIISSAQIAESVQYRELDQKYWR